EASGEAGTVRRRHADYFRVLAEAAYPDVFTVQVSETWRAQLEAEHDNLRAALAWSLAADDRGEQALRLAGALSGFWQTRGSLSEGRQWLARALALEGGA